MATLKIADREEVIERALTDAFAPRFRAIANKLQEALRKRLTAEHPKFLALIADPETKPYVAVCGVGRIYLVGDTDEEKLRAVAPQYGRRVAMLTRLGYYKGEDYSALQAEDTVLPPHFGDVVIANKNILRAYRKAWTDYSAACDKLYALLNSYTVREKFAADFPEFAKYLPPIEKKAALPMIVIPDVRKALSAVGVPA